MFKGLGHQTFCPKVINASHFAILSLPCNDALIYHQYNQVTLLVKVSLQEANRIKRLAKLEWKNSHAIQSLVSIQSHWLLVQETTTCIQTTLDDIVEGKLA